MRLQSYITYKRPAGPIALVLSPELPWLCIQPLTSPSIQGYTLNDKPPGRTSGMSSGKKEEGWDVYAWDTYVYSNFGEP